MARILSLAPQYDRAHPERLASHFVSYHDSLQSAAAALGHELLIVTQDGAGAGDVGVLDVLPRWPAGRKVALDWEPALERLGEMLSGELASLDAGDPLVVLRFEGKLQEFRHVVELARRHPEIAFIWNLFAVPPGPLADGPVDGVGHPPNLHVLADTWQRHRISRSLGIPSLGVWPLHSNLAVDAANVMRAPRSDRSSIEVLVLLAGWQSDDRVRRDVARTIDGVARRIPADTRPRFTLAGAAGRDRVHERWLRRLERRGVRVLRDGVLLDAYRDLIRSHDLVWLPHPTGYRTKSSGKALDALVAGVPLLAPAGSYGAAQFARWVPGGLDYVDVDELVGLLEALPRQLPAVREQMLARRDEILEEHDPRTSIRRLIEVAGRTA